jgi:hypothetical protein
VPDAATRLLIVGPTRWTDAESIRGGIAWMLDRYGAPGAVLLVRGTDGFDGRVALAWRTFHDLGVVPDPELHQPDHHRHGLDARDVRNRDLLAHGRVTAMLAYTVTRKDIGRAMIRLARDLHVPTWRWSLSLARPVLAGIDAHQGRRHRRRVPPDPPDPAYDT